MKQLITFKGLDGENEFYDYGIYDKKYTDDEIIKDFYALDDEDYDKYGSGSYWRGTSLVKITNAVDIDDDKIKIMKDYGVAYEHSI